MEERAARDQRLVASTLEGDTDAFSELVVLYQRLVASVAWRYGIPRDEVEDAVSEVFIKAFRNLHQYRPENAVSTWLYRLAANHVVDLERRKRKERGRVVAAVVVLGKVMTIPLCAGHESCVSAWFSGGGNRYVPDRLGVSDTHRYHLRGRSRLRAGSGSV